MAKYTRFDPRNKKKNKQKNQYLEKYPKIDPKRKSFTAFDEDERDPEMDYVYKKYNL
jgi:hypothetical protein